MKKYVLGLSLAITSMNCLSAEVVSAYTKITQVYPLADGLTFDTIYSHSLSTCEGGKRWSLDSSLQEVHYQTQVGVLLAAFFSGKDIRIIFDGSQGQKCYPVVSRFQVK